jgi:hypothetical protein
MREKRTKNGERTRRKEETIARVESIDVAINMILYSINITDREGGGGGR